MSHTLTGSEEAGVEIIIKYVYRKQEEIIENLFKGFLESYANSNEVTPDTFKENFAIDYINIEKRGEYFLEDVLMMDDTDCDFMDGNSEDLVVVVVGNPNKNKRFHNYYQIPIAYMDCKTKKMCYTLED